MKPLVKMPGAGLYYCRDRYYNTVPLVICCSSKKQTSLKVGESHCSKLLDSTSATEEEWQIYSTNSSVEFQ